MKLSKVISALLVSVLLTSTAFAASIAVIVHPDNSLNEVSKDEIKRLFLSKTDAIKGKKLKAVAQNNSQSIRIVFDEDVLGKNPSKVKAYWARMVFTASGMPPPELDSNTAIIKWVSENPDAIGYIEDTAVNSSVKVLKKF